MRIRPSIKNEQGFTLIEIMSVMAILAVVSLIATSALGSHSNQETVIASHVNKQLASARFVEQIRFDYESGESTGLLSIDPPDGISTTDITVNGESYPDDTAQIDIDFDQPLRIAFVLTSPDGSDLPIQATWQPK